MLPGTMPSQDQAVLYHVLAMKFGFCARSKSLINKKCEVGGLPQIRLAVRSGTEPVQTSIGPFDPAQNPEFVAGRRNEPGVL